MNSERPLPRQQFDNDETHRFHHNISEMHRQENAFFASPSISKIRQKSPPKTEEELHLQSRPQVIFDEVPLHVAVVQTILPGCCPWGFAGFSTRGSAGLLRFLYIQCCPGSGQLCY